MMMLGPIWLVLVVLCVVGLFATTSHSKREHGIGGVAIAIAMVVGVFVLMRVLRITPSIGHVAGLAGAGAIITIIACIPSYARRKLISGTLILAGVVMAGMLGLGIASRYAGHSPFGVSGQSSVTEIRAGGPHGVQISIDETGDLELHAGGPQGVHLTVPDTMRETIARIGSSAATEANSDVPSVAEITGWIDEMTALQVRLQALHEQLDRDLSARGGLDTHPTIVTLKNRIAEINAEVAAHRAKLDLLPRDVATSVKALQRLRYVERDLRETIAATPEDSARLAARLTEINQHILGVHEKLTSLVASARLAPSVAEPPIAWADNLDEIIAKLERSKGHPPIARLLAEMRQLKARLVHLDNLITDPQAHEQMAEKLAEAMVALEASVDVLGRIDQHELSEQIRGQIEGLGDLFEEPPPEALAEASPEVSPPTPAPMPLQPPLPPSKPLQARDSVGSPDDLDRQSAWRPEGETAFEADLYPSVETAGRALARALGPLIDAALPDDRPSPGTIEITGRANRLEPDIGYVMASRLRDRFPDSDVVIVADELLREPPADEANVRVVLDHQVDRSGEGSVSIIRAAVLASAGEHLRTTRYIDKPWLAGFDAYVSARPNESLFLARSALAHTREEASNQAVLDAVAQVKPMVMDYLAQYSSIARDPSWRQWADGWLNDHLANSVREGWIVVDRFAQRLDFPTAGGDQWREAILIRVDAKNLSALEGFARAQFRTDQSMYQLRTAMQRRETMTEGAAAAGLVVLLVGVYVFLQLSTRGYYKWTVRLTMLVLIVIALAGTYGMLARSPMTDHGSFVPSQAEFGSPYSH